VTSSSPIKLLASHPFPQLAADVLRDVTDAAAAAGAAWFVGGATARDILTTHRFGLEQTRATRDVDIGVSIASWQDHQQLRNALVAPFDSMTFSLSLRRTLFSRIRVIAQFAWTFEPLRESGTCNTPDARQKRCQTNP